MIGFLGRSIGPWGTLAVAAGTAVLIPSAIALLFTIFAVASALVS